MSRSLVAFVLVSLVLAVALVPGALRGEVLTQANLLTTYLPWQAYVQPSGPPPNPVLFDPPILFYPLLVHTVESIQRGEWPIWNPGLYGGQPFLAAFQTALFSPFTWLALVVPLPHATVFMALAPLVVGGLGMFLYVRALGLNPAASWCAGVGYLLNGFSVVWMEHPLAPVACWLPWILRAIDAVAVTPDARRVGALAIVVALLLVAGHPETATKILLLSVGYALAGAAVDRTRRIGGIAIGAVAGVLIAAIQIVPFVEYLLQSEALLSRDQAAVNRFFMPAATAITALVPDFFGNPGRGPYLTHANRFGFEANYAEQAIYAGIPALILAAVGVAAAGRQWRVRFFAAAAVVSLTLMYGMPGVVHAISGVPLLRVMVLARFGLIAITAVLVLAAYGTHALTEAASPDATRRTRAALATAAVIIIVIGVAYASSVGSLRAHGLAGSTAIACALAAASAVVTAAVVWLRSTSRSGATVVAFSVSALLAVDLVTASRGFHQTVPAAQVFPALPEIDAIRKDAGLFRVFAWGTTLPPNTALAYGLQDARGWDGMNPFRYVRLLDLGYLRQTADGGSRLRDPRILDVLNVKYVLAPADVPLAAPRFTRVPGTRVPLYENTRVLPRAFLVDRVRVLDDEGLKRTLHDGSADLSREVLLERDLEERQRPQAAGAAPVGTVAIRQYRSTIVELDVDAPGRRVLVLGDAFYPGWVATIDGRREPILRADFALRAVPVPAGRHVVRFEYRPLSLRIGAALSILALVAVTLAAARARAR